MIILVDNSFEYSNFSKALFTDYHMYLPHINKKIGMLVSGLGVSTLIARYVFDYKPKEMIFETFALSKSYLRSKSFTTTHNQMIDEIGFVLLFLGFLLIIFSKEKKENEHVKQLRNKSFQKTLLIYISLGCLATLFLYGTHYLYYIVINMVLPPVLYIAIFEINKLKKG